MVQARTTQQTISELEEIQDADVTLPEAVKSLHRKENVSIENIWPAIMEIRGIEKEEAKNLAIKWCGHWDNNETYA